MNQELEGLIGLAGFAMILIVGIMFVYLAIIVSAEEWSKAKCENKTYSAEWPLEYLRNVTRHCS